MAQLEERLLPIPEVRSLNPVVDKNYIDHLFTVNCIEKVTIKKKRPGRARLKFLLKKELKLNFSLCQMGEVLFRAFEREREERESTSDEQFKTKTVSKPWGFFHINEVFMTCQFYNSKSENTFLPYRISFLLFKCSSRSLENNSTNHISLFFCI